MKGRKMLSRTRSSVSLLATYCRALGLRRDDGATSVECALLVALIAIVIVVSVRFYGGAVVSLFRTYPELISS